MRTALWRCRELIPLLFAISIGCGASSNGEGISRQGRRLYERKLERSQIRPEAPIEIAKIPQLRAQQEAAARRDRLPWRTEVQSVDAGGVRAEWIITPEASKKRVIVYLHGGGFVFGSVASHRRIMALVGEAAQARVLGVDYRLAPEHPFPAALDDTLAAYKWLLGSGFEADRIAFVGDSAGGGLALAAMMQLKIGGTDLPSAVVLVSPWVDLTGTLPSISQNADLDPILRWNGGLEVFARAYAGSLNVATPFVSPLRADLGGGPPIFILVGEREILLDDSRELARRLRDFGVDVRLRVWPGMWHGWQFHAPRLPEAKTAVEAMGSFLTEVIPDKRETDQ